jgi:hypothetical protein
MNQDEANNLKAEVMSLLKESQKDPELEIPAIEKLIDLAITVSLDIAVSLGTIAWAIQSIDERMLRSNR